MAINRPRDDQPAPLAAVAQRRMAGGRLSCFAGNALAQGKKVDRPPLREGDRGKADPRQISPSEAAWAPADRPGGDLATIWPLPTRGQQRSQRNQVCVRVNGGKRAENDRLLPHVRCETQSALLERIFECEWRRFQSGTTTRVSWCGFSPRCFGRKYRGAICAFAPEPELADRCCRLTAKLGPVVAGISLRRTLEAGRFATRSTRRPASPSTSRPPAGGSPRR
jgi:hypothetical protein